MRKIWKLDCGSLVRVALEPYFVVAVNKSHFHSASPKDRKQHTEYAVLVVGFRSFVCICIWKTSCASMTLVWC